MTKLSTFVVLFLTFLLNSAFSSAPPKTLSDSGTVKQVWAGLTQEGYSIPSSGQDNPYLSVVDSSEETIGQPIDVSGFENSTSNDFVQGTVSWFGGPKDMGVISTETGAITGQVLRDLDENSYYAAMRFDYGSDADAGLEFWRKAKLLVVNPSTGQGVVVQPVDWGPDPDTGRLIDLSPGALNSIGLSTNQTAWVSFATPDADLGPVN